MEFAKKTKGLSAASEGVGDLCFPYAEDRGSAVRADAFDGRFAVLERHVLWVLDLYACLTFHAICLWHFVLN